MRKISHFCLSAHPQQLERWSQAFPDGEILADPAELVDVDTDTGAVLWVHANFVNDQSLEDLMVFIKKRFDSLRVVVITNTPSSVESLKAVSCGAAGYCHAQSTVSLFQQVATVVTNSGLWLGADLMDRLLAAAGRIFNLQSDHVALNTLTPRERDVALAVASGKSNREIATTLDITERTVKAHLSAIFDKLDIRDRLQLVVLLRRDQQEH